MKNDLLFRKYHGTGNDFILIDDRSATFDTSPEHIQRLCHRRYGVGADGLIVLRAAADADFRMVYFNADGLEGSMCGNGGRCVAAFAYRLGLVGQRMTFIGVDGLHDAEVADSGEVRLKMSDVHGFDMKAGYDFVDTGSPHLIVAVDSLESIDVPAKGRTLRHDPALAPGGANINFVEVTATALKVRTFERGVEEETLSCGTGVTAVALTAHRNGWVNASGRELLLQTRGGDLAVCFEPDTMGGYRDIWLKGPAVHVFEGRIIG